MSIWTVVLLAAFGTFLFRVVFLVALRNVTLPPAVARLTDLVLPAAMAAILGAAVFHSWTAGPATDLIGLGIGALVTAVVARRTGSLFAAVGAGLAMVAAVSFVV